MLFEGLRDNAAPAADQLEVTVFGPGLGECILVHLGGGNWINIDSCTDPRSSDKSPVPLRYLTDLNVDPAHAIKVIVATHWHSDHINGISKIVTSVPNALVAIPQAMGKLDFLRYVSRHMEARVSRSGTKVQEMDAIFQHLKITRKVPEWASTRKLLFHVEGASGHGERCEVWALSPNNKEISKFIDWVASAMPKLDETHRPAHAPEPNAVAIVIFVKIGDQAILLGSDLEETADPDTGWSAVIASHPYPGVTAKVFKIPHHGSQNAHSNDVWEQLVFSKPAVALTPYSRLDEPLPRESDVKRILSYTSHAYTSAQHVGFRPKRRDQPVMRTLREGNVKIRRRLGVLGAVRLRCRPGEDWETELLGSAARLSDI